MVGRGDRKRPRKKRREQESEPPFPSILGKNATIFLDTISIFISFSNNKLMHHFSNIFCACHNKSSTMASPLIFWEVGRRK